MFDEFYDAQVDFIEPAPLDVTFATEADLTILQGNGNDFPVQTDTTIQTDSSPLQILGSIGTVARDVGTAVGKLQADAKTARTNYTKARTAAASGNSLQTWWLYASATDKLMVGLGVVAIIVALKD